MNISQNYKLHIFALSALFTLGNTIILLPSLNLWYLILLPLLSLLILLFSFLVRKNCNKNQLARRVVNIIVAVVALYGAITSAVDYISFLKTVQNEQTTLRLLVLVLVIAIAVLVKSERTAIYKYSLFAYFIVAAITTLLFVSSIKDFKFDNLKEIYQTTPPNAKEYLSFLIPLFALPFFIGDKEKREKAVCVGVMAGVLIIFALTFQVLLTVGINSGGLFSYQRAISVISLGSLFTRLDGLCWFVFFATTIIKCTICVKIAIYSIKLSFVDIYKQKTL